jgi:hypothetical protein
MTVGELIVQKDAGIGLGEIRGEIYIMNERNKVHTRKEYLGGSCARTIKKFILHSGDDTHISIDTKTPSAGRTTLLFQDTIQSGMATCVP